MRPAESQPALDADVATDASLMDRAAAWRIPRLLAALEAAVPAVLGPAAAPEARQVLVAEPGRGRLARALAAALPAGSGVTALAGRADDEPAAPGATFDEAFVERRTGAADLDLRTADAAGWSLEPAEAGRFDLVVIAGGLAAERALDERLDDARTALHDAGTLVLLDDDAAALAMHPPVPLFEAAWRRRLTRRAARGHDPATIRRMPERLDRHRLRAVGTGMSTIGGTAGEPHFPGVVTLLADLLLGGPAGPVAGELRFDAAAAAADRPDDAAPETTDAIDALARWSRRPGATVWWPLLRVSAIPAAD